MWDLLFGEGAGPLGWAMIAIVLLAAAAGFWAVRRATGQGDIEVVGRNKQPQQRLDVLEALDLDQRRRLMLIRRDNVEHLILIGGPSDLVIEASIAKVAHLHAVREQTPREEALPPQVVREAPPPQPQPQQRPQGPREKPLRPVETEQPPAAVAQQQAMPQRRPVVAQERPAVGDPTPRRLESGLAAAANALEQALRKPFGASRPGPHAPEPPEDADHDLVQEQEAAVTPFPAARNRGEDLPYDLDSAPAAQSPAPRFPAGGPGRNAPPAAAGRGEAGRESGARPTPFPGGLRPARPQGPPQPGQRPQFGSSRALPAEQPRDLKASRADRAAPMSLEDEMATLLDEISGVRERG